MNLDVIRNKIDDIDAEIVSLLKARMDLAIESKAYKKQVEDLNREQEVLDRLKELAKKRSLNYDYLLKIYKIIFSEGKSAQNNRK